MSAESKSHLQRYSCDHCGRPFWEKIYMYERRKAGSKTGDVYCTSRCSGIARQKAVAIASEWDFLRAMSDARAARRLAAGLPTAWDGAGRREARGTERWQ